MKPIDLPEHVAESDEWKRWPRKIDAHLAWGLRQRQIEQHIRTGLLKVYACPDGVKRLDPDVMREHFGEPGVVSTTDRNISAAERERRQREAEVFADPALAVARESLRFQTQLHEQLIGQLKIITEPMQALLAAFAARDASQAQRIRELEERADAAAALRSELEDARQEREIQLKRYQASEKRRDETLQLLKDQLPALVGQWLSGDSLSGFAKRTPRGVLDAILESETLSDQDAEILRRAAGIPKPSPNPQTANGVSDHGHS